MFAWDLYVSFIYIYIYIHYEGVDPVIIQDTTTIVIFDKFTLRRKRAILFHSILECNLMDI